MTVARAYLRVSTDKQADAGVSLASQLAAMETYAVAHHLTIIAVYRDVASGRGADRAQYQQLLSDLRAGEIVLCWALDRGGRNVEEMYRFRRLIAERKASLVFVSEPEASTPLIFGVKAVMAEEVSRQIAAKVLPNMRHVVEVEHRWVSKPPTWYRLEIKSRIGKQRRVYAPGEGRLIPNEDYPGQAVACWEMLRATNNVNATARAFGLTYDRLAGMIDNPAYIGVTRWHGSEIADTHPPLVPRDLWEAVRAARVDQRAPPLRTSDRPGLLTGFFYRADSHDRLHHRIHNRDTAWARWFYVTATGPYVSVRAEDADSAVVDALAALSCSPATARAIVRDAERTITRDPYASTRAALIRRLDAITVERTAATRALLRGAITEQEHDAARRAQDEDEAEARATIAALPPLPDLTTTRQRAAARVGLARAVHDAWDAGDTDALRPLLMLFVARVELWDAEAPNVRAGAKAKWVIEHPPRLHLVWLRDVSG